MRFKMLKLQKCFFFVRVLFKSRYFHTCCCCCCFQFCFSHRHFGWRREWACLRVHVCIQMTQFVLFIKTNVVWAYKLRENWLTRRRLISFSIYLAGFRLSAAAFSFILFFFLKLKCWLRYAKWNENCGLAIATSYAFGTRMWKDTVCVKIHKWINRMIK